MGAVEITTSTTGGSIDVDGYSVELSGRSEAIGVNDDVVISDLPVGSADVVLTGVATNCEVAGTNPRTIAISTGTTTHVTFEVTCSPIGAVRVTTITSGGDLDPDGYSVSVASLPSEPIGIDATLEFGGIDAGPLAVALGGLADNCTVLGENPREVEVIADQEVSTVFEVACAAPLANQIVFFQ